MSEVGIATGHYYPSPVYHPIDPSQPKETHYGDVYGVPLCRRTRLVLILVDEPAEHLRVCSWCADLVVDDFVGEP